MNGHPNEPLSAEERDLAARLSRLGPHDGPPPGLDAKIMSAARQAMNETPRRTTRRRWLGLSGGAGGLVTGLGFAASLTLVLGVVWQMRPTEGLYMPTEEGDASEHVVMIETLPGRTPETPTAAPGADASAEAAQAAPAAPAAASNTAAAAKRRTPSATSPRADGSSAAVSAPDESDRAAAAALLEARRAAEAKADVERATRAGHTRQEAAQQARAVELRGQAAAQPLQGNDGLIEEDRAPAFARRATYTRAARATPERPERAPAPAAHAPPPPPEAPAAAAARMEADDVVAMPEPASPEALAALPVEADAALDPTDWLERIRARKAAGDLEAARESLALLRAQRPYLQVPDDLADLLLAAPDPAP